MTRKLFWSDPYRTSLDTNVEWVGECDLRVSETIFFASSGGQESDHGSIAGSPVLRARLEGADIVYTMATGGRFGVGDRVRMAIDWERRYRLMRLHLAAEIALELLLQNLPGIHKAGAHISPRKARIDFIWEQNIAVEFGWLSERFESLVQADHKVDTGYSDAANARRYWEITGFARVPCGGTHVHRTGELGQIGLRRKNPGKGRERVELFLVE